MGCGQHPGAECVNFKTFSGEFRMGEARNFKFDIRIDLGKSRLTNDKITQKGMVMLQGPNFFNFETSSI